ncbi:hypothetical protein HK104_007442, partial [Borealophlyctis nickersoniae]
MRHAGSGELLAMEAGVPSRKGSLAILPQLPQQSQQQPPPPSLLDHIQNTPSTTKDLAYRNAPAPTRAFSHLVLSGPPTGPPSGSLSRSGSNSTIPPTTSRQPSSFSLPRPTLSQSEIGLHPSRETLVAPPRKGSAGDVRRGSTGTGDGHVVNHHHHHHHRHAAVVVNASSLRRESNIDSDESVGGGGGDEGIGGSSTPSQLSAAALGRGHTDAEAGRVRRADSVVLDVRAASPIILDDDDTPAAAPTASVNPPSESGEAAGNAPKISKHPRIAKFNSCSTLFVEHTITNADLNETLRSTPTEEDVYRFLECLFHAAELNVECAIITL